MFAKTKIFSSEKELGYCFFLIIAYAPSICTISHPDFLVTVANFIPVHRYSVDIFFTFWSFSNTGFL